MKSKNVSDPIVVEIFRVEKNKSSIDTEGHQRNGVDLLQDAMITYEPDLYHPEVLIKASADTPLIRNKIEELDIEESQNTTALFAEVLNLDTKTQKKVTNDPPMNRAISIDKETGKLVGVALTGSEISQSLSAELLEKAFKAKSYKSPIIIHQAPITYTKSSMQLSKPDKSTRELMGAIENYILQTKNLNKVDSTKETDNFSQVFKTLKEKVFNKTKTDGSEITEVQPPPVKPKNQLFEKSIPETQISPAVTLQSEAKALKGIKVKEPDNQIASEKTDDIWLKPSAPLNWKQRKNRDRNIIDLTERIIRLSKKNDTPPKEMIVSFLASLGSLQYEFLDKLINCFTAKIAPPVDENSKVELNQETLTIAEEKFPEPIENEIPIEEGKEITQENMQEEQKIPEDETINDPILADPEFEGFNGISEEEKALHLKILDYQKKYNVSYDHAASMILK